MVLLGIIMLLIGLRILRVLAGKRKFNYVNCIRNNIIGIGILFVHTSFY
jgi:uncharacterized membrane protein